MHQLGTSTNTCASDGERKAVWMSAQVSVHLRGKTECFECQPKQAPKTYPVCTIRNTPDKPIHCIVWAKDLLFQRLFGRQALDSLS